MIYVASRNNKDGTKTWRITYLDENGKRCRMSSKLHPKFLSKEEAENWAKTQQAYEQSRRAKAIKKAEWRTKFYDFKEIEGEFVEWHKTYAPNSYKSDHLYLTYVFDFFLNVKQQGNVNMWNLFHEEFKAWLIKEAVGTKKTTQKITYSTANHCIKTLNNLQNYLTSHQKMDREANVTCKCFPQHLVNKRGYEDVITYEEYGRVLKEMRALDSLAADFFVVAFWTGMRVSEILGLSMSYLYGGKLEGPIADELATHKIPIHGYIVLESQIRDDYISRNEFQKIHRKPLKTRKKINAENARTIPITDKDCWNVLVGLYKSQQELYSKQTYGLSKDDYPLFDGLNMTRANTALRNAYERLG
ncbi:MAG: hypothetical protein EOP04_23730, partial [Proteobacteria bacterium]